MASYDDTATVSGSVVSIENGADDVPTKSLVVTIPPTLSGVSLLNETQTGRNMVALNASPQQAKRDFGITVNTQTADTLNITTTGAAYACERLFYSFKKGTYAVKFLATSSDSFTPVVSIYRTNGTGVKFNIQPNTITTFTLADDADIDIRLFASGSGDTAIRTVEYTNLQIEVGSTVSTYSQYNSTQYTASLGRTIYGGEVDIVNGVGTNATNKFTVLNTTEWSNSIRYIGSGDTAYIQINNSPASNGRWQDLVCYHFTPANIYAGGTQQGIGCYASQFYIRDSRFTSKQDFLDYLTEQETLGTPLEICYKLATPTDFTFTGQEIPTKLGYNAFWSDSGDTELTYYKSGYGFTSVTVNKTGKNLIDGTKFTRGLPSTTIGASINTITTSNRYAYYGIRAGGGSLTVSSTSSDTDYFTLVLIWGYKDGVLTYYSNAQAGTSKTVDFSNCDYVRIGIGAISGKTVPTDLTGYGTIQLELGSQASSYEPYEAVSKTAYLHKVIYGGQADVVKGTCEPKNLLKLYLARTSHQGINFSLTDEGLLHMEGTNTSTTASAFSGGNYSTYDACPWKFPAGTYTASSLITADTSKVGSVNFLIRTKTDNVNYSYALKDAPKTFTINDDFGAWFWASVLKTETVNCDVGVQLEKGSTASEYAPHFEPFSFPPISMSTDEGENTLFANEGDSAITYRKAVD